MPKKIAHQDILDNWITFVSQIASCSLDDCRKLLELEVKGRNRLSFIERLAGRIAKLESVERKSAIIAKSILEGKKNAQG